MPHPAAAARARPGRRRCPRAAGPAGSSGCSMPHTATSWPAARCRSARSSRYASAPPRRYTNLLTCSTRTADPTSSLPALARVPLASAPDRRLARRGAVHHTAARRAAPVGPDVTRVRENALRVPAAPGAPARALGTGRGLGPARRGGPARPARAARHRLGEVALAAAARAAARHGPSRSTWSARSAPGTNMLTRALDGSPEVEVRGENDRTLFDRFRLREHEVLVRTVRASRHRIVLVKPLCDSQHVGTLLDLPQLPGGRALWAFRDPDARARSELARFDGASLRALRAIADDGAPGCWQGERLPAAVRRDRPRPRPVRPDAVRGRAGVLGRPQRPLVRPRARRQRPDCRLVDYDAVVRRPGGGGRAALRVPRPGRAGRAVRPRRAAHHPPPGARGGGAGGARARGPHLGPAAGAGRGGPGPWWHGAVRGWRSERMTAC